MAKLPKKTLAGVVGAIAAGVLTVIVPKFEGVKLVGYLDPVGIPTKCMGDTRDVVVGRVYSEAECRQSLETQLIAHAEPVLRCTPGLKDRPYQLAAAVSFAYNVGANAYCASTTAKRFNAGDLRGACRAINEADDGRPQWVTARGRVLPGLVKRRAEERAICERGL
ncbi:phage lysozyme family protein [Burkholderia pseudomallei]|uniref:lysozyme n=1 Tax=Burkholderia pseudomallei TaxID=28450 RepID=UPI000510023B|nr:lysozyme [Burkholderia pseudomallei]KGC25832.1 phage lysozyme family protein [Burkholderia pseudomallei]KGD10924.1 phage lysozyme family protein [Burkholderia pseudomallei]KGS37211.1 phage lysozyme family protein [Burkholderia pseudomallei ABCPW 107]KGS51359.1 phage lysozyme family protein [Burkholderia pseudomallei MSHR5613]KGV60367.1 phage lysozyme family protein [Burkholderia pseudomallei ABCPW 91]